LAIQAKLWEDCLGNDESPWQFDTDNNAISIAATGGVTTVQVVNSEDDITGTIDTAGNRFRAWQTTQPAFADGVVRATMKSSMGGGVNNQRVYLLLRTDLLIGIGGDGTNSVIRTTTYSSFAGIDSTPVTFASDIWYDLVVFGSGGTLKVLYYSFGTLPPFIDYKTVNWTWISTNAAYPTGTGHAGIGGSRNTAAQPTWRYKNILAYASTANLLLPTPTLTPSNGQIAISTADAAAKDKRAALWYFYRYKAGSQPTNENDGTLIVGTGTGMGGSGITTDGIFVDAPTLNVNLTGLTNGTQYFIRPFAVMGDGTIVAGTAVSTVPSSGDITPPVPVGNFNSAYASPFVASRIDLTWTNPTEVGTYRINYRTDGISPTSATDGSATVAQDWTSYTASSAGSKSVTGLTDGTRYMFAIWFRDAALNISAGSFTNKVSVHQVVLSAPADAATGIQTAPYLVWASAGGEQEGGRDVHFRVEVSTTESSEVNFVAARLVDQSSMSDGPARFQYEDSPGVWVNLPATGLLASNIGKNVRYQAIELTTAGHYYWRVRAEQPGT
jgi:hypothetical protein